MGKKKDKTETEVESTKDEVKEVVTLDPFIGGEEDDLMDMEYIQDETTTTKVETHPPETEEEREAIAEFDEEEGKEDENKDIPEGGQPEEGKSPEEKETETETEVLAEPEEEVEVEEEEGTRVPKSRFDEVNNRMKEAEDKVSDLQKQIDILSEGKKEPDPAPEPYDFDAKEQEAADALLEGDTKKYQELRGEIRAAEKEEFMREARQLASDGDNLTREELAFDEVGREIEADYPALLEGSEDFNKEAYDDTMDLYVGYVKSGRYSRPDALRKAADKAAKIYQLDKRGTETEEEEPDPDTIVDIKKADVKKKAEAANKQPPVTETTSTERTETSVDISSMSDEEFNKLPESTKRRLRGDVL